VTKTLPLIMLLALAPSQSLTHSNPQFVTRTQLQQVNCLAEAIYYEARGEPHRGKLAVAYVIHNRVKSPKFPPTVCAVVRQPGQFTYKRSKHVRIPPAFTALAYKALTEPYKFNALYFHSNKITPQWGHKVYARIGNHIFYS
jgi:spore germination cell wall hydrolase CwlJ-like protein